MIDDRYTMGITDAVSNVEADSWYSVTAGLFAALETAHKFDLVFAVHNQGAPVSEAVELAVIDTMNQAMAHTP